MNLLLANSRAQDLNALKNELLSSKFYENPKWLALLHYEKGKSHIQKDSNFFLSKNGHKSPKDEYIATINAFFNDKKSKILCEYPARFYFLAQQNANLSKLIDTSKCEALNDFLSIVPIDTILLEFAAESEIYPGSSMGHIFLHLQGVIKKDFNKSIENRAFVRKEGDKQDYAMSYFAIMSEFFNPLDYAKALSGTLKGSYALNPYDNAELDYLENEKRSLYVFKIRANEAQIHLFTLHLWELKNKHINYNFITHNCTNGIENILAVLDNAFVYETYKPFITPTQYIQYLTSIDKIELVELKIPPQKQIFNAKFGNNDILNQRDSSKFAFGVAKNQGFLYFAPIYSDIKNANNAYKEFTHSRLASIEARISRLSSKDKYKFSLHKIELLELFSIADTLRTKSLSKLISVRFEPNLYEYKKGVYTSHFNKDTRLFPNLDLGLGVGTYAGAFGFYALGNLGYRFELIHNPYLSLKSGFVGQFERVKIIGEYQIYYDLNANNRGYDNQLSLFAGFHLFKQIDILAEFNVFKSLFHHTKPFYESKDSMNFKLGLSKNF